MASTRAVLASLIETCKLNDVDPEAYLADVFAHLVEGHPINRLDEFFPGIGPQLTKSKGPRNTAYGIRSSTVWESLPMSRYRHQSLLPPGLAIQRVE